MRHVGGELEAKKDAGAAVAKAPLLRKEADTSDSDLGERSVAQKEVMT